MSIFHADTVGSLLRPQEILTAREKKNKGEITEADLRKIEDEEIKKIVDLQVSAGLKIVSDGEFRRDSFWLDFPLFHGGVKLGNDYPYQVPDGSNLPLGKADYRTPYVYDKLTFNPIHPEFGSFEYLKSICPANVLPKVILPSPVYFHLFRPKGDLFPPAYKSIEEFNSDLGLLYKQSVLTFYNLGARVVQIDEPAWFIYPWFIGGKDSTAIKAELKREMDITVGVIKAIEHEKLKDLQVIIHLCRGNGNIFWKVPITYADVLPGLVAIQPSLIYMEYDDERSGTFNILKDYADQLPNSRFFLGLVTTKNTVVETVPALEARVQEAATYVALDRLGVTTQCGFATFKEGNPTTNAEAQWGKIRALGEVAKKVWGD